MTKISRLGDTSDHGGEIVATTGSILIDGKLVAVNGSIHHCTRLGHGDTPISASSSFKDGGNSVVKVGDVAGCGAKIITGSDKFDLGG